MGYSAKSLKNGRVYEKFFILRYVDIAVDVIVDLFLESKFSFDPASPSPSGRHKITLESPCYEVDHKP